MRPEVAVVIEQMLADRWVSILSSRPEGVHFREKFCVNVTAIALKFPDCRGI